MPTEREILIKDRFQPGDYVYVGEHTEERLQRMAVAARAQARPQATTCVADACLEVAA